MGAGSNVSVQGGCENADRQIQRTSTSPTMISKWSPKKRTGSHCRPLHLGELLLLNYSRPQTRRFGDVRRLARVTKLVHSGADANP